MIPRKKKIAISEIRPKAVRFMIFLAHGCLSARTGNTHTSLRMRYIHTTTRVSLPSISGHAPLCLKNTGWLRARDVCRAIFIKGEDLGRLRFRFRKGGVKDAEGRAAG